MSSDNLLDSFKPLGFDDWKSKAIVDLKGQDFDKKLFSTTPDNITIAPFYSNRPQKGILPQSNPQYYIMEAVEMGDDANKIALHALNGGAQSILFNINHQLVDYQLLIKDIKTEIAPVYFSSPKVDENLWTFLKSHHNADIHAGINPFDIGTINNSLLDNIFHQFQNIEIQGSLFSIDAHQYRESGISMLHEAAIVLAQLSDLLQYNSDFPFKKIVIYISTGANYFFEIARLMALRQLIAVVQHSLKIAFDFEIVSVITQVNKSTTDIQNNILRQTSEAMSAILGGADAVCFSGFDLKDSSDVWKRTISRNIFHILNEEAGFLKNTQVAAGSFYVESLVKEFKEKVWAYFLEIENQNGFSNAYKNGFFQEWTEANVAKMKDNINKRKSIVLGANQFSNPNEIVENKMDDSTFRLAKEFENLREKVQILEKKPTVFLWQMGNATMRKARATFAYNFFACAGIDAVESNPEDSTEAILRAIHSLQPDIIVFCADNESWSVWPDLKTNLPQKSKKILAGNPKFLPDNTLFVEFDDFIFDGCNVLNTLKSILNFN